MDKIKWCLIQKSGIKLIERSENLSKEYMKEADSDFLEMKNAESLKWKDIEAYYSCYNISYSLLMKLGIKCEIHDCTIELLKYLSKGINITKEQLEFIEELKKKRIDVQYYLKEPKEIDEKKVADFLLTIKKIINELDNDKIDKIRGELNEIIQQSKNEPQTPQ